jgi:hypothetical protein
VLCGAGMLRQKTEFSVPKRSRDGQRAVDAGLPAAVMPSVCSASSVVVVSGAVTGAGPFTST